MRRSGIILVEGEFLSLSYLGFFAKLRSETPPLPLRARDLRFEWKSSLQSAGQIFASFDSDGNCRSFIGKLVKQQGVRRSTSPLETTSLLLDKHFNK